MDDNAQCFYGVRDSLNCYLLGQSGRRFKHWYDASYKMIPTWLHVVTVWDERLRFAASDTVLPAEAHGVWKDRWGETVTVRKPW